MATPFALPIEYFFRRVEEDRQFFNYFALSNKEAMELANNRATQYLYEACSYIMFECPDKFDFLDYDQESHLFRGDLNKKELLLLSGIMYQMYISRDIAKLKCWNVNFTPTDLRVFDPSNARKTYLALYERVVAENDRLLDIYRNTDPTTGMLIGIDFGAYDESE